MPDFEKCTDRDCPVHVSHERRRRLYPGAPSPGPHCHEVKRVRLLQPVTTPRDPAHILRMVATMLRGKTFSPDHIADYSEQMAELFDMDKAAR